MNKAALVVIFNHRYERNIPKLEEYYGPRFSHRSYLVPFAPIETDQIIRVIENSYCFSGHIAQGICRFKVPGVTHYVFAGDDLILNPVLNEDTLLSALSLDADTGYIKSLASADRVRFRWRWALTAYQALQSAKFDWKQELPPASQARSHLEKMGIRFSKPLPRGRADLKSLHYPSKARTLKEVYWDLKLMKPYLKLIAHTASSIGKPSEYPLLAGYSDFVVVPAKNLDRFAHYCGVLAALNMFAEVAVPTALALACDRVDTELRMGEHFADAGVSPAPGVHWHGIELWEDEIPAFGRSLNYSWPAFMKQFPSNALYHHPIKLSQWA